MLYEVITFKLPSQRPISLTMSRTSRVRASISTTSVPMRSLTYPSGRFDSRVSSSRGRRSPASPGGRLERLASPDIGRVLGVGQDHHSRKEPIYPVQVANGLQIDAQPKGPLKMVLEQHEGFEISPVGIVGQNEDVSLLV